MEHIGMEHTGGVYCIRCVATGEVYVGSSADIPARLAQHTSRLRHGRHDNGPLQCAWAVHGGLAFEFRVLCQVDSASELAAAEADWVKRLSADKPGRGFNLVAPARRNSRQYTAAAGNAADASCMPFQRAIEFIGRRWVGAILFVLLDGPARSNELLASVPNLSDRLLTERLRELEAAGMVTREVLPGPPVKVVYELTDAGHALSDIIHGISDWAHKWMPDR